MQLQTLMPDIATLIPADYSTIRCKEYDDLLCQYMSGIARSMQPRFVQVSGIPGAGKSSFCASRHWDKRLLISFDAIMEKLSAYQSDIHNLGLAESFKKWEIPARIIGYELLRRAVEIRADIYLEHSGVNQAHIQLVESLPKYGYQTEIHFILCPRSVAEARAKAREQQTNRHTPPTLIAERYNLVDKYLQTYAAKVDSLFVYDSTETHFVLKRHYLKGNMVNAA